MIGSTVAHYTILEKLGEGGMGVVYKALDTKLDRTVALKFLPPVVRAADQASGRFLLEAKAAAALNHPHVCSIHAVGEHDGQTFIDMEFVEGQTLRNRIAGGPVPLADAVSWALQIADALQEAHGKGIVHRDIKSDNIMITPKGRIKVMDFGLAKLKGALKLTRTSSTIGTLAYMAPEQIKGGEADARSDVFSFGVVLYELLTGRMPFRGEHEASVMYSILNEEPEPLAKAFPEAPPELVHILGKALEKDPELRYQSVADMAADLRRSRRDSTRVIPPTGAAAPATGAPAAAPAPTGTVPHQPPSPGRRRMPLVAGGALLLVLAAAGYLFFGRGDGGADEGRRRLVVLPFENLGSPEQEYFADGITEEITGKLSGLSGLGVIATASARQYKNSSKTFGEVGNELGVDYILQGTIRWSPGEAGQTRVRVSPALIRVDDGTQVWSQSFNAVVSDVFSLQSDIASQVAGAMGISLLTPERENLGKRPTENTEAYDFYLRGNEYFRRSYERTDFEYALELYSKAVELDPGFALSWSYLSQTHAAMYWFYFDHTEERVAKARTAADRALELDPALPDAHMALGYYYYWCRLDYRNALAEFETALRGRPNDGHLLLAIGAVQRRQGKVREAVVSMTRALEVDPRRSEYLFNIAQSYQLLREYDKAEDAITRAIALSPDVLANYATLVQTRFQRDGTTERARAALKEASALQGNAETELAWLAAVLELWDGRYPEALKVVESRFRTPMSSQFRYLPPVLGNAYVRTLLGDVGGARLRYDSARVHLEQRIRESPDDGRYHSALGIALAGLGRAREAEDAARRGVELMPIEREAWRGSSRLEELAQVFAMTGRKDSAVALLQRLFAMPGELSPAELRHDPRWKSLQGHPAFTTFTERLR